MNTENIAVIGAGTMGHGIAQVFAQHGFPVHLADVQQDKLDQGMAGIEKSLSRLASKDKISEQDKRDTLARIRTTTDLHQAGGDAGIVIEAVSENLELKLKVFAELDQITPEHCILASNTSSISITRLASETRRPEKVTGMHFFNPVPVMKLVEIVKGHLTSEEIHTQVTALIRRIGKQPVTVSDSPGFISNRVLMPMINEAIFCLHEGIAAPGDIDEVMKLGMAHPMGPLRLADFIGLDVCLDILRVLQEGFGDPKYRPCPLLVKMVDAGKLGNKTGEGFYKYED